MLLSVVIAAKDPPESMINLCLASFACLQRAGEIEIVLVLSGILPKRVDDYTEGFANFRIVVAEPKGVYAAYNAGVKQASGKYVLFFGIDDIALPAMNDAIDKLAEFSDDITLFAASSLMQASGVSIPSTWPPSILFRNWCHQGLIYDRRYFDVNEYEVKYFAQADHKLNIDIISDKSLKYETSNLIISYFSSGGVSQTMVDIEFRKDLPAIAKGRFGVFYGFAVLIKQRLADAIKGRAASRI